jgi:hypothetical protein
VFVVADNICSNSSSIIRRQCWQTRYPNWCEVSTEFDCGRPPGEKKKSLTFEEVRSMADSGAGVKMVLKRSPGPRH